MKKKIAFKNMVEVYRFAEFGKLSSSLFHDLINPLTAMSLHLDSVVYGKSAGLPDTTKKKLEATLEANMKMRKFISTIRKQLSYAPEIKTFSVKTEIMHAVDLFLPKASKEHIQIVFNCLEDTKITGNPLRFNQIMINLISNAIDSYACQNKKVKEK